MIDYDDATWLALTKLGMIFGACLGLAIAHDEGFGAVGGVLLLFAGLFSGFVGVLLMLLVLMVLGVVKV